MDLKTHADPTPSGRRLIVYSLYLLMFFFAIASTMVGNLVPEMTSDYALTNTKVGYIGSIQNVGGFVAMLLGGLFSDRFSKVWLIGLSFLVYTAFLYFTGMLPPFILLIVCFFMLGVASNYLSLLISAYVSELFGEKREHYLNLSHAFYGVGSLTGPVYASVLVGRNLHWNEAFVRLGVLCTVIAAVFVAVALRARGVAHAPKEGKREPLMRLLADRRVALISLCCLVYMGQQSVCSLWVTSYSLNRLTSDTTLAGLTLILYWGGVVGGRFLQSAISARTDYRRWLMYSCCASAALIAAMLMIDSIYFMLAVLTISGALTGAAFPSLISMGCALYPDRPGAISAIVCLSGSVGGVVFTWMVGGLIDAAGYSAGMSVIPAALLASAAFMWLLIRREDSL